MLYRICAVMLWAAFALSGDVCIGLPREHPTFQDPPRTLAYRLSVKPGVPSFRITVRPGQFQAYKGLVHAGDIEVARCRDGRTLQLIPFLSDQPIDFAVTFLAEDINFDGYLDFSVLTAFGGKWGSRSYWVYEPGTGQFVENVLTRELAKLKTNGYHLDPKKHEIITENIMAGCPPQSTRYRLTENRLLMVHTETPEQFINEKDFPHAVPPGIPCTVTYRDLVYGRMRVTRVRRFVDEAPIR